MPIRTRQGPRIRAVARQGRAGYHAIREFLGLLEEPAEHLDLVRRGERAISCLEKLFGPYTGGILTTLFVENLMWHLGSGRSIRSLAASLPKSDEVMAATEILWNVLLAV